MRRIPIPDHFRPTGPLYLLIGALLTLALLVPRQPMPAASADPGADQAGPLDFQVTFDAALRSEPVTGRVYVALSREMPRERTPIEQTGPTGVPLFGTSVEGLRPGEVGIIDGDTFGHPLQSLSDLPAGEYWVQAFMNVYTRFDRADGHTVWMHMDQWEGQSWKRSPGNLYSDPVRMRLDPVASGTIRLVCDRVIPPVEMPEDTEQVKYLRFQSKILSEWWGHPIFLGAAVLLPKGYDEHPETHYPVNYNQGHFSLRAPGGFGRGGGFDDHWMGEEAPRFIYVTLQHPSPYYDDSYGVNSENNGPYGDAIMEELIPAVEERFRVIREPWARMLSGGSTGGWIALAHQVFYPDFYGGVFASCPDAVDFRYHQIVDVYEDENAYWFDEGWMRIERPNRRSPDGNIRSMMKDENWYELVVGDRSRSGGQWDIWEATYGPVGPDGYPARIWDKRTGEIDHEVAAYWRENYDLRHILERDWATLGPKLVGKIHIYTGDMDSYYLNNAAYLMEDFLEGTKAPYYSGEVAYQARAPHCWGPRGAELLQKMAIHIERHAPPEADLDSWRYP
ncbi:MAG: alpha/beta hydrolase-fold protein [bacterium]